MMLFEEMHKFLKMDEDIEFVDPFSDDFFEIFTQKRMQLIRALMGSAPSSIRDLAKMLERDVKNVFGDLKLLNSRGLVDFKVEGKCKKPVLKKEVIIFSFRRY